ncbi:ribulose-phosphate 3-epimerase [Cohnella kolymensis]|uniref:Ribulose-phosphate 3-epimerase n=1 Tax=Cohnella kolymensis TaxID=1590652 RepID=A0ABR5A2G4_9BACL|nr:ribulose-phosphate 3-epimerase [Cohnella kolymensis]KIL35239.1 ribulose-phosphate 3-epimerase [Cohnella kolymensis]
MIKIAPSILASDFARLGEEIRDIDSAGADWIHIDIMDGHFVPNLTFGPPIVSMIRPVSKLCFDVHLMVESPETLFPALADAGADRLTVHPEACVHLHRTLMQIRELGMRAGVALNPHTPLSVLEYILDEIDLVLIMTINPGFGGQSFLPAMLPKLRQLREMLEKNGRNDIHIEVDGGINVETASLVIEAGADALVAGTYIFGQNDRAAAIASLRAARSS